MALSKADEGIDAIRAAAHEDEHECDDGKNKRVLVAAFLGNKRIAPFELVKVNGAEHDDQWADGSDLRERAKQNAKATKEFADGNEHAQRRADHTFHAQRMFNFGKAVQDEDDTGSDAKQKKRKVWLQGNKHMTIALRYLFKRSCYIV